MEHYFKHFIRRYEGEVALAKSAWGYFDDPLPRNEILWHPQFARTRQQGAAFTLF